MMTLEDFKGFLTQMIGKYNQLATLSQANAIYIAFATDMLKVVKGSSLAVKESSRRRLCQYSRSNRCILGPEFQWKAVRLVDIFLESASPRSE